MSQPTLWDRVKTGGKSGFDKGWKALDKLGAPVNKLSNKLGSEAFWPTTLDKESDKAARILKSFCKDGFYAEEDRPSADDGPKQKQKVIKKIPAHVIKNARGLAIFTTMRTGLWISGAGGSGILVGRTADGSWSPPSGILLHTAGLGFLVGIDIYDCVVVINTDEALEAFTKLRCTLGSEVSVAAGPVGAGGILDSEVHKRQAPIFTYLKSRGFYAGVQIDGTVIIERTDENERFYGYKFPVKEILAGKVRHPPYETRKLLETIKAAQGDTNVDESLIPQEAPPSDYEIDNGHVFGVPEKSDPDPYGVLALEKEGMSVKEAGTQKRASWEAFSFHPSPTSPVHNILARQSGEGPRSVRERNSWRASAFSNVDGGNKSPSVRSSLDHQDTPSRTRATTMSDMATQTDLDPPSPGRGSKGASRRSSRASLASAAAGKMPEVPENGVLDTSPDRKNREGARHSHGYSTPPHTPPMSADDAAHVHEEGHDEEGEEHEVYEQPVVRAVQPTVVTASPQKSMVGSKPRIVDVPKRIPPKLPPRNPQRSGPLVIDASPAPSQPTNAAEREGGVSPIDAESESKHDSAHEPSATHASDAEAEKKGDVSPLEDKMTEVQLGDPPAREATSPMPGGFD